MPERPDSAADRARAESFLEDVRVVNTHAGERRWTLLTKRASIAEGGETARMEEVTVELPEEEMTVTADSGLYHVSSRDLTLDGNIRAVTPDYTITTSSMSLSSGKAEITADDRVVLESDGFRIEGYGLRAEERRAVRLERDVKAVFF